MVFFCFLLIPFITEQFSLSDCSLVNFIKRGLHVVLLCSLVVGYRCLEINGRKMEGGLTGIFRQCFVLQNKFNALGLHFPPRAKVRFQTSSAFVFGNTQLKWKLNSGSSIWMDHSFRFIVDLRRTPSYICYQTNSLAHSIRSNGLPNYYIRFLGSVEWNK